MISAKGGAPYFQILFPVNGHAVEHDFHCLIWSHLSPSFHTISGSPFQSFSIKKMSLYFCWFCTWFTVDCVEILVVLFRSLWLSDKQSCCLYLQCVLCVLNLGSGLVFPAEFQCQCSCYGNVGGCSLDIRTGITDPCWVSRFWSVFLSAFFCGNVTSMFKTPLVLLYIITNCACVHPCICPWKQFCWSFPPVLELQHSPDFVLWFMSLSCLLDFTKSGDSVQNLPPRGVNGVMNTPVKCGLRMWTRVCHTATGSRSWCVTEEE